MIKQLTALSLTTLLMTSALAQTANSVVGSWKLLSYEVEAQSSGQRGPIMGARPSGFVTFTADGRVAFVLTGEGRKAGKGDAEKALLLDTLVAYAGSYTTEGETWATQVEVAWNPEWVGNQAGAQLQGRRRAAGCHHALARHAQLGRQGCHPQHRDLRACEMRKLAPRRNPSQECQPPRIRLFL